MAAYSVIVAGITLALHGHDDFTRRVFDDGDAEPASVWRHRAAVTVAILLWLLTWLGGWWLGRMLSSGSFVMAMAGACVGWCLGLVLATLILYMDERL